MRKWLHDFFSVSNEINENVVIGVVFALCTLISTFAPVGADKYYTLAGMTLAFFGVGALKK